MNKLFKNKTQIIGSVVIVSVILLFSANAFAQDVPDKTRPNLQKETVKVRLQDAKLRACQAKEKSIKNRSANLADLAKKMQDKFDAIAKRVQDYYTNTVIPSGKTVANYDTLVADIQIKKTAVELYVEAAKNNFSGFSCTEDNPKEAMRQFKENMQAAKQALKEHRTSIKNLIVAVRSITGAENNNNVNSNTTKKQPNNLSEENTRQTDCQSACQRSCGANADCVTECYANCRGNQ